MVSRVPPDGRGHLGRSRCRRAGGTGCRAGEGRCRCAARRVCALSPGGIAQRRAARCGRRVHPRGDIPDGGRAARGSWMGRWRTGARGAGRRSARHRRGRCRSIWSTRSWRGSSSVRIDEHGGFGVAPKLPEVEAVTLLLRRWRGTRDAALERIVRASIDAVLAHLGDPRDGGVFRYAAGADWSGAHTEKLALDQALLARLSARGRRGASRAALRDGRARRPRACASSAGRSGRARVLERRRRSRVLCAASGDGLAARGGAAAGGTSRRSLRRSRCPRSTPGGSPMGARRWSRRPRWRSPSRTRTLAFRLSIARAQGPAHCRIASTSPAACAGSCAIRRSGSPPRSPSIG